MKNLQLSWVVVILTLAAVVVAVFLALSNDSWDGPEKGVVMDNVSPRIDEIGSSSDNACGITNCHGLDIVCGSDIPDACTMEYRIGDNCRQYAECGVVVGRCQQITSPEFTICKSCVAKCLREFPDDNMAMFECESKCSQIGRGDISDPDAAEILRRRSIIESLYPKFKNFENRDNFAGARVKTAVNGSDYYFAYITEGSGVPIVAATCFRVDADYKLYYIGDLGDSGIAGNGVYTDVDPVGCEGVKIPLSPGIISANEATCTDCGQGGWEKMDYRCGSAITSKESFKICLENFDWYKGQANIDIGQISDGYIEIGSMEILNSPAAKALKVMIYRQWAVDGKGNLYLLGQLG